MNSLFRVDGGHSQVMAMARQQLMHSESDQDTTLSTIVSDHGITSIQQKILLTYTHTDTQSHTQTTTDWPLSRKTENSLLFSLGLRVRWSTGFEIKLKQI